MWENSLHHGQKIPVCEEFSLNIYILILSFYLCIVYSICYFFVYIFFISFIIGNQSMSFVRSAQIQKRTLIRRCEQLHSLLQKCAAKRKKKRVRWCGCSACRMALSHRTKQRNCRGSSWSTRRCACLLCMHSAAAHSSAEASLLLHHRHPLCVTLAVLPT